MLETLCDVELCVRAQAGCKGAAGVLVERHTAAVISLLNKIKRTAGPWVCFDSLVSAGLEALWRAALKFRPADGNKFITYAFVCVSNAMRRDLGMQLEPSGFTASQVYVDDDGSGELAGDFLSLIPDREPVEIDPTVREWVEGLPPLQRVVVGLAFGLDGEPPSWAEIAGKCGLTVPQAKRACEMATGRSVPPESGTVRRAYKPRERDRSRSGRAATALC